MKILHVTQNYFPSIGGTQYMMQHVSDFLSKNYNDEITVFTSNSHFGPNRFIFKKIIPAEEIINNVQVKRFSFLKSHKRLLQYTFKFTHRVLNRQLPFLFHNVFNGPFSYAMYREMLHTNADVVGASSVHYMFSDYPLWRKRAANPKPFVLYGALHIDHHGNIPAGYLKRIKACEYYIANTHFEKNFIERQNIESDKIIVLGGGTDLYKQRDILRNVDSIKEELGLKKNDIVITCIARHENAKNLQLLLDTFLSLCKNFPGLKLIIAGAQGSFTGKLKAYAANHSQVIVRTDISDEEKCKVLAACDFFVLPSMEESFGVVFLEAWAFSKPVIGANIGAIASIIKHGKDGYLFEPRNALDFRYCIETLINDKEKCIQFGNAGYEKVLKFYTWNVIATGFRNVYGLAIEKFERSRRDNLLQKNSAFA